MNLGHVFRIAKHEKRLILKEPRFLIPFLLMPLLLIGVQAYSVYFRPFGNDQETLLLTRSLLLMLAVLAPSASVPLGADSFAGEKERNTLEILLCLPIDLGALFWGKVLGMYPLPVLMGWLGQGTMMMILSSRGLLTADFAPMAVKALLLTPAVGLFLCAFATWMSLISDSVRAATQITSLAMLGIFFAIMSSSLWIFDSWIIFSVCLVLLVLAALACLGMARLKFPKLS